MIGVATAVISAIPSIMKLFDSDSRSDGVKELTNTVVGEVGKKLGVEFKTKEDVVKHMATNPEDAVKLREIDAKFKTDIEKMYLEDKQSARDTSVALQESTANWLVKSTGSMIAIGTIIASFTLFVLLLIGTIDMANPAVTLILGFAGGYITQILSFYFGSSKQHVDENRGN